MNAEANSRESGMTSSSVARRGLEADCKRSCFRSVMFIPPRKPARIKLRDSANAMDFVCREQVRVDEFGSADADRCPVGSKGTVQPRPATSVCPQYRTHRCTCQLTLCAIMRRAQSIETSRQMVLQDEA